MIQMLEATMAAGVAAIPPPAKGDLSLSILFPPCFLLVAAMAAVPCSLLSLPLFDDAGQAPKLDRDASAPEDLVVDRAARRAPSERVRPRLKQGEKDKGRFKWQGKTKAGPSDSDAGSHHGCWCSCNSTSSKRRLAFFNIVSILFPPCFCHGCRS